jgi:hypothetical protein
MTPFIMDARVKPGLDVAYAMFALAQRFQAISPASRAVNISC